MGSKLAKSLPKRCGNERLKARRARSWQRGQERKAARVEAQNKRTEANRRNQPARTKTWVEDTVKYDGPVTQTTSYVQIRRQLNKHLGQPGCTPVYLDDVHRRWTVLGKKVKGGAI